MRKSNQAASHCGLCVCASQRASERVCLICMMKGTKRRARRMKIYFCALVCFRHTLTHSQKACGESRTRNSELTKFADRARTFVPRSLLCSGPLIRASSKKAPCPFLPILAAKHFHGVWKQRFQFADVGTAWLWVWVMLSFIWTSNKRILGWHARESKYVCAGYNWFPSADSK